MSWISELSGLVGKVASLNNRIESLQKAAEGQSRAATSLSDRVKDAEQDVLLLSQTVVMLNKRDEDRERRLHDLEIKIATMQGHAQGHASATAAMAPYLQIPTQPSRSVDEPFDRLPDNRK